MFSRVLDVTIPDGWVDQNKAHYARTMQVLVADTDVTHSALHPSGSKDIMVAMDWDVWFRSYRMLALIAAPNFVKARQTTERYQTLLNLAYTALAIERHRAAKSAYPDTLAALVPEFAPKLPNDIFGGQPFRYRRTDEGSYVLYSIGSNLKDDGGQPDEVVKNARGHTFTRNHDSVWQGVPKK